VSDCVSVYELLTTLLSDLNTEEHLSDICVIYVYSILVAVPAQEVGLFISRKSHF